MGLIKSALKAAVAVKAAHVVNDRIQERKAAEAANNPAPTPPASAGDPIIDQLTALSELRSSGVLTHEEFEAQKARILGQ